MFYDPRAFDQVSRQMLAPARGASRPGEVALAVLIRRIDEKLAARDARDR